MKKLISFCCNVSAEGENSFINALKTKFVFLILLFSAFSCGGGSKQKS